MVSYPSPKYNTMTLKMSQVNIIQYVSYEAPICLHGTEFLSNHDKMGCKLHKRIIKEHRCEGYEVGMKMTTTFLGFDLQGHHQVFNSWIFTYVSSNLIAFRNTFVRIPNKSISCKQTAPKHHQCATVSYYDGMFIITILRMIFNTAMSLIFLIQ